MSLRPTAALALAGLASLAAAPAFAFSDLERLPGRYQAQDGDTACTLRLNPPARTPEDSLIEAETLSGLALAFPGCPGGLSEAMLWRAPADGSGLSLVDGAGSPVFDGAPDGSGGFQGQTPSGAEITLRRD